MDSVSASSLNSHPTSPQRRSPLERATKKRMTGLSRWERSSTHGQTAKNRSVLRLPARGMSRTGGPTFKFRGSTDRPAGVVPKPVNHHAEQSYLRLSQLLRRLAVTSP